MRLSELTAGYSLPFWFSADGLKSSTGGAFAASIAAWAWAARSAAEGCGGGACAPAGSPNNTGTAARIITNFFIRNSFYSEMRREIRGCCQSAIRAIW
jgi:hypothetical protein